MTYYDLLVAEDIYEELLELQEIEEYIDYMISSDLIDAIAGITCAMRESRYANS